MPLFCFILYVTEGNKPESELCGSELTFFALKAVFAIKSKLKREKICFWLMPVLFAKTRIRLNPHNLFFFLLLEYIYSIMQGAKV